MNKIEQVKKIITDLCDGCEVDGVSTGLIEIASKEIVSALYSEPQVVCPHCEGSGRFYADSKVHYAYANLPTVPCAYCDGTGKVSACIPVPSTPAKSELLPDIVSHVCQKCGDFFKVHYTSKVFLCPKCSTPASEHIGDVTEMIAQHGTNVAPSTPSSVPLPPDELLTDEEKINITNDVCKKNNTSWDEVWELPKLKTELIAIECYEAVAKAQLLKCHQSEAAIRADQNKKIADIMLSHVEVESGLPPRWVADLIAKLQKGEEVTQ